MNGPREKKVTVGGREFLVKPCLGEVQRKVETTEFAKNTDGVVELVSIILGRTAPDATVGWLLKNGDQREYTDVLQAWREVTTGKKETEPGEAPAP